MKSDKMPYIIYVDLESLIKKIDGCTNNPEKSSTIKIGEHIPCGKTNILCIMETNDIKNKHTLYRGKNCMKEFCKFLREHVNRIIGFGRKKLLPLTNKEVKSHEAAKVCYIYRKYFIKKLFRDIN